MNKKWETKYLEEYGTRFTRKQKIDFANEITKDFESLGCKTYIQDLKLKVSKVQNILIGNFKMAKTIIIVPYDTQSKILFPNYKTYPQDGVKSMSKNFLPVYTPMIISYLLLLAIIYGLPKVFDVTAGTTSVITLVYFILLMILIFRGFSNKNNTTNNNLSTVLALDFMESLPLHKRKEVAIIFTDKNNNKMTGSKVLLKYMEGIKKNTNMICLYCIGQEDSVSIVYQKGMKKNAQSLSKKCDHKHQIKMIESEKSVQLPIHNLTQSIMISSGKIDNELLSVSNTRSSKDSVYDEQIYNAVKEMLVKHLG